MFSSKTQEIAECVLDDNSMEVATTIAGYVAKKLIKRSKCDNCISLLKAGDTEISNDLYFNTLSRDGLFVPSKKLAEFVCSAFAILDFIETGM